MGGSSFRRHLGIFEFLRKNEGSELLDRLYEENNPFDRYGSVKFHALFLFESSNNFQSSMEAHWLDLNYLTGNDLDVYFSEEDLSKRASGYKITNALSHLKLKVDILPALLLWEGRLNTYTMISLQGLDPKRVVEVMKTIVQAIRDGCPIEIIKKRGESRSIELRNERKNEVLIRKGGIKSMSKIKIYGDAIGSNIGSSGDIIGSTAIKGGREKKLEKMLTPEDVTIIKNIRDTLKDNEIEGIKYSERIEGVLCLAELADAENKYRQEQKLAKWEKWLDSLAERSQNIISFLANTVTITVPIATLLGIYPS